MKAKQLAEILLENPEYDVKFKFTDFFNYSKVHNLNMSDSQINDEDKILEIELC